LSLDSKNRQSCTGTQGPVVSYPVPSRPVPSRDVLPRVGTKKSPKSRTKLALSRDAMPVQRTTSCVCVCVCVCVFFGFASEAEGSGCDSNVPMVIIVASLVRFGSLSVRFYVPYGTVRYLVPMNSGSALLGCARSGPARLATMIARTRLHCTQPALLCFVVLCCVLLCFVVLCCVVLCRVRSCSGNRQLACSLTHSITYLLTHSLTDLLTPAASG